MVIKSSYSKDFNRQRVQGIFFLKHNANPDDCHRLVQELGCQVQSKTSKSLTIHATRERLQELKSRYLAKEDDISNISSRLKLHFDRILIGGNVR